MGLYNILCSLSTARPLTSNGIFPYLVSFTFGKDIKLLSWLGAVSAYQYVLLVYTRI